MYQVARVGIGALHVAQGSVVLCISGGITVAIAFAEVLFLWAWNALHGLGCQYGRLRQRCIHRFSPWKTRVLPCDHEPPRPRRVLVTALAV